MLLFNGKRETAAESDSEPEEEEKLDAKGADHDSFALTDQQRQKVLARLNALQLPPRFGSKPAKALKHPGYMKAHDWMCFVTTLGLYAMRGVLQPDRLRVWAR